MGTTREHALQALELWNQGDLEALRSLTAQDIVEVGPEGTRTGLEAVEEHARRGLVAFPDRRIQELSWVEDGDTIVVEGEWKGTNNGPLTLGDGSQLPPTGQRCTIRLVSVIKVQDGKTVAHRTYRDQLPMMMQLGLVAPTTG